MADLAPVPDRGVIAQAADQAASAHLFDDYRARKAANTIRRQDADLALFARFLGEVGIGTTGAALAHDGEAWRGISWGLVGAFVQWQLRAGYAVASVNIRLATVRTYARLAFQAGTVSAEQHALIRTVQGYQHKEQAALDTRRAAEGLQTRQGRKKAAAVPLSPDERQRLKTGHPDTPQGRRDAVLMCLLLDHGLRVGEIAGLSVGDVDLAAGELRFYRPKVDKRQTHRLTRDTLAALRAWFDSGDAPAAGPLLRRSLKSRDGHKLGAAGMSARAITKRVATLGRRVGLVGLSAHDGRHNWATTAARQRTDVFALQEAGGWASLAMPRRYVEAAKIANEGVRLE